MGRWGGGEGGGGGGGGEGGEGINIRIKGTCLREWDIGGFRAFMAIFQGAAKQQHLDNASQFSALKPFCIKAQQSLESQETKTRNI